MRPHALIPAAALAVALAGCTQQGADRFAEALRSASTPAAESGPAVPIPRYDRDAFGGWIDADHDGCNTRAEVLEAAAGADAYDDSDRNHCRDDAPIRDAYTGRMVEPGDADIDHALPLEKAWYAGMYRHPEADRIAYANDQRNLIATSASVNRSKGSDLPPDWTPPDSAARCHFAQVVLGTERIWSLALPTTQHSALNQMLDTC